MRQLRTLDEVTEAVAEGDDLYVRWSRGPGVDLDRRPVSTDDLSGAALPGLSASPLAKEDWWGDRPLRGWVARRLYDYSHLRHEKGPGVRPWLLRGRENGRGRTTSRWSATRTRSRGSRSPPSTRRRTRCATTRPPGDRCAARPTNE
jgi:hypothetical protein